jgi:hypothetical protein
VPLSSTIAQAASPGSSAEVAARSRLEQSMAELRRVQRAAAEPRAAGPEDLLNTLPSIPPNLRVRSSSYFPSRLDYAERHES